MSDSHDKNNLVKRLRETAEGWPGGSTSTLCGEAALRIEELERDLKEMDAENDRLLNANSAPSAEPASVVPGAYWLIERGQPEGQEPTIWWGGPDHIVGAPYGGRWTEDATKARKFSDRGTAVMEMNVRCVHNSRAAEHVFLNHPALPSEPASDGCPPLPAGLSADNLLTFLEQAGAGCISGRVSEWPQLKPACKWAAEEIKSARSAIRDTKAASDVLAERIRQREEEGWDDAHDDEHTAGNLALAGACYAANVAGFVIYDVAGSPLWPWELRWWKPKGARRDLVRAAALILAEIEKLDRGSQQIQHG